MEVFPIPSQGKINVTVGNNYSGNINVNVFSIDGKLIETEIKTVKQNDTFQLKANLIPGIYLLQMSDNNKVLGTHKIVVVKE